VPSQQSAPKKKASGSTQKRSSRQASPARLPTELSIKVKSQTSRFNTIQNIAETQLISLTDASLDEINTLTAQLDEVHKAFTREHAYFEVTWPEAHLDHHYFTNNIHEKEAHHVLSAKLMLSRLRHNLGGASSSHTVSRDSEPQAHSRLPDIKLSKFNGDYANWPSFRELFSAVILQHAKLNDVEKLHYLRSCVQGPAEQLIRGLPLTRDSLQPSWDLLTSRYENKRLIMQSHLDNLFSFVHASSKSAASLTKLISTVSEANKALHSLGMTEHMWDCFLVHHVSRFLDRDTREAWETSLGSSQEYPRFAQFETFLNARARALERLEITPAQLASPRKATPSSFKSSVKKATAHQVTAQAQTQSSSSTTHPCDICNGQHFIVTCTKFRDLTPAQRKTTAIDKRLCFSCLGRHNVRSCRSTLSCKTCSAKHHSMLHVEQSSSSSAPAQSASSSAQ